MRQQSQFQFGVPKLPPPLLALIIANVAMYVIELIVLRVEPSWIQVLILSPSSVFSKFYVHQILTYSWLHSPDSPFHLVSNMLMLWWFGAPMYAWWGKRRFLTAYFLFAASGGLFTLATAGFLRLSGLDDNQSFFVSQHLGASGATVGLTLAWGLVHARQQVSLLFFPPMKGITLVWIMIGMEFLVALSFANISWTSHFGGMTASVILCKGLWRPSKWRELFRQNKLKQEKKRIEKELRIIEGGKGKKDDWN